MNNKWYSSGLHFECLGCGNCCSGPAEGFIWVAKEEIELIADFLKIPVRQLRRQFLKRSGFRLTIVENPVTKDCIFLKVIEGRKQCVIYSVRPNQCRTWPFWPNNLSSPDIWNRAAQKCPGINRGRFYSLEEIEKLRQQKKWWEVSSTGSPLMKSDSLICEKVAEIYSWLDSQIQQNNLVVQCKACGRCCDFENFGHLLFITTPELIFLKENLNSQKIKTMPTAVCPYNEKGRCTIYPFRFASCRIFFCNGDKDFQNRLSESVISRFKSLCTEFDIPYIYSDLKTALNVNLPQLKC